MVRMENNITRIAQGGYQFKQLNCILAAITSYRHITATKRLKAQSITVEMERKLKRIFEIAINVHSNHRPANVQQMGSKLKPEEQIHEFLSQATEVF